jgi:hypothetical protein
MSARDIDYQYLPSGPLREWLDWVYKEYQDWQVICDLAGLHPRVLYRVRESDYVSVRIADILFSRIGGTSLHQYYDDEDIIPRGELHRRNKHKGPDDSADAERRRVRRAGAREFGDRMGLTSRYVLEHYGEFWSDGKLFKLYNELEKHGSMYHKRRVMLVAQQMGLGAVINADEFSAWRIRDYWIMAVRFQRPVAPRVWGKCLEKLGAEDDARELTEDEYKFVFFTMDELAREVVMAAQVFGHWRWSFYVLKSLELCGWKPAAQGAGPLAPRAPVRYTAGRPRAGAAGSDMGGQQ